MDRASQIDHPASTGHVHHADFMQVASEATLCLEAAKRHSNVQLESAAFSGLPDKVDEYIKQVEGVMGRTFNLARGMEMIARYCLALLLYA